MSQNCPPPRIGRCCSNCNCPVYCHGAAYPEKSPPPPCPPTPKDVKPFSPKTRIRVLHIDSMVCVNGPDHHTERFASMRTKDKPELVIRRGQPFLLRFNLDRNFTPQSDGMSLIFMLEGVADPKMGNGTEVIVPVFEKGGHANSMANLWFAIIESINGKHIIVKIQASTQCLVGEWRMEIDTKYKASDEGGSYVFKEHIIILFNPWNENDQVYVENEQCREAFVLNEAGVLVRNEATSMPWFFGQFQKNVLKMAVHLLRVVHPEHHEFRHDPVSVVRALSGALNSDRDKGVLVGKWADDFTDGTNPNSWVGSTKILQEFYKTKLPLKYGQCWVFAALCVTVCRALGIAARPVTVLDCAHDSDGNFIVDITFNNDCGKDSIWDYHVMTEVWMRRPDMSEGGQYDGWNVVDCTPQARAGSNDLCGPASVRAIKYGEDKPHDVGYLFCAVNADVAYWNASSCPIKLVGVDTKRVGTHVLTQNPDMVDRVLDVTENYKFPEGSREDRMNLERLMKEWRDEVCRFISNQRALLRFSIIVPDQPMIGSFFEVEFQILNLTDEMCSTKVTTALYSRDYTGSDEQLVKRDSLNLQLIPAGPNCTKPSHIHVMKIHYDDYRSFMRPSHNSFNVYGTARISAVSYDYFCTDRFRLRRPKLIVTVPRDVKVCEEFTVTAYFDNPLPAPLTRGQFTFEGTDHHETIVLAKTIPAKSKASEYCKWKVRSSGDAAIMVSFVCQEFSGIYGHVRFSVN